MSVLDEDITASTADVSNTGESTFLLLPPPVEVTIVTAPTAEVEIVEDVVSCFRVSFEPNPCFEVRYDENPCFVLTYNPNYDFDYIYDDPYDYGLDTVTDQTLDLTDLDPQITKVYGVWYDIDGGVFHEAYALVQKTIGQTGQYWLVKFRYDPFFGHMSDYTLINYSGANAPTNLTGNSQDLSWFVLYSSPNTTVYSLFPTITYIGLASWYTYGQIGYWDEDYLLPSDSIIYTDGSVNGVQHCGSGFTNGVILKQKALTTFGDQINVVTPPDMYARSPYGYGIIHKQGEWYVFQNGAVLKNPTLGYFSIGTVCHYGWRNPEFNFNIGTPFGGIQIADEVLMVRRYDSGGSNAPYNHPIDFYDLTTGLLIASSDVMSDATLLGNRKVMYSSDTTAILEVVSVDTL